MSKTLAVGSLCVAIATFYSSPGTARSIDQSVVTGAERPGFYWGVMSPYATINIIYGRGEALTLFIPNLSENQFLPKKGDTCGFRYRERTISAMLRSTTLYLKRAPLVFSMRCNSGYSAGVDLEAERRHRSSIQ
jgi:hypothetical protein